MGVLSGKYSVHGGVIRNASGHIIRHLVPAATSNLNPFGLLGSPLDIANTFQLKDIAETTQQLVSMSQATMALSGLNLAVSAVDFAALYSSLKEVESQIRGIDLKVSCYMDNLVSRNDVLIGYESQYQFLLKNSITPSRFDAEVHQLPANDAVDGIFILAPKDAIAA